MWFSLTCNAEALLKQQPSSALLKRVDALITRATWDRMLMRLSLPNCWLQEIVKLLETCYSQATQKEDSWKLCIPKPGLTEPGSLQQSTREQPLFSLWGPLTSQWVSLASTPPPPTFSTYPTPDCKKPGPSSLWVSMVFWFWHITESNCPFVSLTAGFQERSLDFCYLLKPKYMGQRLLDMVYSHTLGRYSINCDRGHVTHCPFCQVAR